MRHLLRSGDTVEMAVDIPLEGLRMGDKGTVRRIVNYPNGIYELEFDVYAAYPPIQIILSSDEIRPVEPEPEPEPEPHYYWLEYDLFDLREMVLHLHETEAANLMHTLRYVQADPTVHPQQRLWSFKLANELEGMLHTPTAEELNYAMQTAITGERSTFIQRHPPSTTPS